MKIIDAVWEKRNLGLSVSEVVIEADDEISSVSEALGRLNGEFEYVVVKLPICRADLSFALTELGFTFMEAMIHLTHHMELRPLGPKKQEIYDHTQFLPMTEADLDYAYAEIKKGLYKTDRVFLDSYFTPQQAANRYIGWMSDELKRGSEVYKLVCSGENAGFVGFKKINNTECQDFLNGIYPRFQGKGLAFNLTYKLVNELKEREVLALHIDISSNNTASLQARLRHGFQIDNFTYVYVKHNSG